MKKRNILGSVIVALLMLVSTQIVFLNIVRSDPEAHEGDADVGDIWISELDVSSAVSGFDFIGITHANATDDWVIWTEGKGDINASWSVDIEARGHPEYFVMFSFAVYNIDDNCKKIGKDMFSKTYIEDLDYEESGTLSVAVEFSQEQQEAGSQTLVCILGACAKINDTVEAVDFYSVALDRCVVAVGFSSGEGQPPPFSVYTREANDKFPSMVSWIDGWSLSARFVDEDDMLNTQTYFNVGRTSSQSQQQHRWHLGNITVNRTLFNASVNFTYGDLVIYENTTNDWVKVYSYMNYEINDRVGWNPGVHMRYKLKYENYEPATFPAAYKYWKDGDPDGFFGRDVVAQDRNSDGNITLEGHLFVGGFLFLKHIKLENYRIQIDGEGNNSGDDGGNYYWKDSCAYQNDSYKVEIDSSETSGITTVEANIYEVLKSEESGESIFTFAGDSGDFRVEFTCRV